MNSLVLDLQQESYDCDKSISSLLRKAYVVARKLKIHDFEEWTYSELNGYKCEYDEIPNYRIVNGELKGLNPFNGWIPVIIDNSELADALNTKRIPDPITNLEVLTKGDGDSLAIQFDNDTRKKMSEWIKYDTNFQLFFGKSQAESIIESVRNIVLEWSLKLEEDGIMGEDMKFTENEKNIAQNNKYTINNFYGNVSDSQIQQNSNLSTQNMFNESIDKQDVINVLKIIKDNLDEIELGHEKRLEVNSQVKTIEIQLESKNPKKSIVSECFKTIRTVLEGATGNIIASGVIHQIGLFINSALG